MGFFDFITNPGDQLATNLFGKDIGGFLGSQQMGKAIESWSNPITQLSDRNPILNLARGTGDWRGASSEPSGSEQTINDINKAAALIYGGYSALGPMLEGAGGAGTTEGLGGVEPWIGGSGEYGAGGAGGAGTLASGSSSMIPSGEATGAGISTPSNTPFTMDTGMASKTPRGGIMGDMGKNLGYMYLAGTGLDYLGSGLNQQAANKGLEQYRKENTWSPERTSAYTNALTNLVSGVYAGEEQRKKKSVAELLAGAGRGGGAYGSAAERIGRERRESEAKLLAAGALETNKPPNLPLGAYTTTSPEGTALSNLGGLLGKGANTYLQLEMLKNLFA